ncbi:MAG: LPS-assembly protein LptD [Paracoccaceae bacterium]
MQDNRFWQHAARWLRPLLVLLWIVALSAQSANAQLLTRGEAEGPVALVADRIDFDEEARTVTATGNVEVYYGERTLTAAQIVYDDRTGRIAANGDIVLRDPTGATVFADVADLDAELRDGLVQGARSVLSENVRLAAVEARRVDGRYNTLSKVVYSPCKVCSDDPTPLWRIRARRVIHDEEARIIHYENATFDVFGVPIAWLPYFRHPDPSVERASGFLTPTFRSSSTYGSGVQLPYYQVIDDQSDFTFTPFFTTNDGLILSGEYRRVFEDGALNLGGSVTYNDYTQDGKIQGHLDTEGRFKWFDGFYWGWDVKYTTDDDYLRRFDFSIEDRLTSEFYVERYTENGFVDAAGVYFQSLRENEATGSIPRALPVFDSRFDLPQTVLGGDLGLFFSGHALVRDIGRDASRLTIGADWEREAILPFGLALTGFAEMRGDLFSVTNDATIREDTTARLTGHVGAEARFPLLWDSGDTDDFHVIEPVIQVIAAPYGGNGVNVPLEDSLATEFDETNVIDRNHFSGLDSFEDGPRVNLALRYQGEIGENVRLDGTVGRVYRFRTPSAFSAGSGLADTESDFVTFWQAAYDPYVQVSHRMRFSDDATITRNEFFGEFKIDPVEFSTSYAFYESDPLIGAPADREEVNAEALVNIDTNWAVSAFLQRDLQVGEFVRVGGQVSYVNECCAVDLFLRRRFTDSTGAPASTSVGVQIRLLTLGDPDER